jgi:hypothetical protein
MSLTEDDKRWITGQLEQLETRLLTAFERWASPNEARQRRYSAELQEFELRLDSIEDRLKQLERPKQ